MSDRALRVLVVDDSVVIRKVVTEVLNSDPEIEVVGVAANGKIALSKMDALRPDLITLDVEMPIMDGLETLRELRRTGQRVPVIMFSTLTERGASATMDALLLGADDYVTKPANVGSMQAAIRAVSAELLPRVKALCATRRPHGPVAGLRPVATPPFRPIEGTNGAPGTTMPPRAEGARRSGPPARVDIVVIGVSTGGPNALAVMLPMLPHNLPVPVVIVQHMPPTFTRHLADRLHKVSGLPVREAQGGEIAKPGDVWVAPGGHHLVVSRDARGTVLRTNQQPPENSCRPAADVLFRSAAEHFGANAMAVVMTGMGYDGRKGAELIRRAGGLVVVQDEPTSVVWGMPSGPVADGTADAVVPLGNIANEILRATRRERVLSSSVRSVR